MAAQPKDRPPPGDDDAILDTLILGAMTMDDEGAARPQDAVLLAYLSGTATDAEREQVEEALLHSESLRYELIALASDVGLVQADAVADSPEAANQIDQAPVAADVRDHQRAPHRAGGMGARRRLRRPTYAVAVILVLLAYPAYRVFIGTARWTLLGPQEAPPVSLGEQVTPGTRDAQSVTSATVVLHSRALHIPVSIVVPDPSDDVRYDVEAWYRPADGPQSLLLRNADAVALRSGADRNWLALRLPLRTKSPGTIEIQVLEFYRHAQTEHPKWRQVFLIEVAKE
jgi:hypothetical protein